MGLMKVSKCHLLRQTTQPWGLWIISGWVWDFYGQIRPEILLCYPGVLGLGTKWGGTRWCCHHEAEPCSPQLRDCKVGPKWSSSLIKSSSDHCSFQFRCCKNKPVAFRKHNQPDGLDQALAFLTIILNNNYLLFCSEADLKCLQDGGTINSSFPLQGWLCATSQSRASRSDECSALSADLDHPCSTSCMFIQAESAFPGSNPFLVSSDVKKSTLIPAGILWAWGCSSSCSCPQRGSSPVPVCSQNE